jgi:radical SAM superfamily enzyme YgiQ (UPF0313 family)
MNVLMINPNRTRPHVAPVGLEYVCNSLLREKIEFDLVDFNFEPEKVVYRKLQENNVDIVGITVRNLDTGFLVKVELVQPTIRRLVQRIKNTKDCQVVLGGSGFSMLPREILEYSGADFGVFGYGEEVMPRLVRALREGGDLAQIDNLIWRKNGQFQVNPTSTGDYENLPARRRNIIRNLSYYRVYNIGNLEVKRGCYKQCGYCCEPNFVGRKVVSRNIAGVLEELKELKSMGIDHVYFCESEFNIGNQEHFIKLCEQLIKSKIGITWCTSMHPDAKSVSQELMYRMKEAGCHEILISSDSGSDDILADMEKEHTAEDTIICSEYMRKANIRQFHSCVIGWPGESFKTLEQTVDLLKRCQPDAVAIFPGARIYPNTKLARIAKEEGIIKTDADLINPVFYRPERMKQELLPFIRRKTRGLPHFLYPNKAIDFLNLFQRNAYLGGVKPVGFTGFVDYMNNISRPDMLKLLAKTALQYTLPFSRRFISRAEGEENWGIRPD